MKEQLRWRQKQFGNILKIQLLVLVVLFLFTQCSSAIPPKAHSKSKLKQNILDKPLSERLKTQEIQYKLIATKEQKEWLLSLKKGDTLDAILYLNRIDKTKLLAFDTLVLPKIIGSTTLYSPFPEKLKSLTQVHKIMLISYYTQAFAVYEEGELIRWGPTSMGKKDTPTPTGLFATNWKSKKTISTINPKWEMKWYFNLDNFKGVSMHQYAMPGYLPHMRVCACTKKMLFGCTTGPINGF